MFLNFNNEQKEFKANDIDNCTVLVVGSDDVAPSYSVGVLTRRQIRRSEGSRGEVRVVASY